MNTNNSNINTLSKIVKLFQIQKETSTVIIKHFTAKHKIARNINQKDLWKTDQYSKSGFIFNSSNIEQCFHMNLKISIGIFVLIASFHISFTIEQLFRKTYYSSFKIKRPILLFKGPPILLKEQTLGFKTTKSK